MMRLKKQEHKNLLDVELERLGVMYSFLREISMQCQGAKTVSLNSVINHLKEVELHIANANDLICDVAVRLHPELKKELYKRTVAANSNFK